jgi:uncharacterized membrane protein YjfL (UPF0719 family)
VLETGVWAAYAIVVLLVFFRPARPVTPAAKNAPATVRDAV